MKIIPIIHILTISGVLLLSGCGDPIGTDCMISGSGFTASHNCREKCLYYNKITCPDGSTVVPKVCSGAAECKPGSCPEGQACYNYDDPFEQKSYCVPDDICGSQSIETLRNWEIESKMRAEKKRSKWAKRRPARKPTAPAMPLQPESTSKPN